MDLLIATTNHGKLKELRDLIGSAPVRLFTLNDLPPLPEIDETGCTFLENALLKAVSYARETGMWSLADDSGLEVDSIGGQPGVRSARFAGITARYDVKIARLLELIKSSGTSDRSARFVCAMVLADPDGNVRFSSEGICRGSISTTVRGTNGFGYDPVFVPDGYGQTFGELSDEVKRAISHRAQAASSIVRFLLDFIAV